MVNVNCQNYLYCIYTCTVIKVLKSRVTEDTRHSCKGMYPGINFSNSWLCTLTCLLCLYVEIIFAVVLNNYIALLNITKSIS